MGEHREDDERGQLIAPVFEGSPEDAASSEPAQGHVSTLDGAWIRMGVTRAPDKDTERSPTPAPGPRVRFAGGGTLRPSRAGKAPLAAVSVESHIVATTP